MNVIQLDPSLAAKQPQPQQGDAVPSSHVFPFSMEYSGPATNVETFFIVDHADTASSEGNGITLSSASFALLTLPASPIFHYNL